MTKEKACESLRLKTHVLDAHQSDLINAIDIFCLLILVKDDTVNNITWKTKPIEFEPLTR